MTPANTVLPLRVRPVDQVLAEPDGTWRVLGDRPWLELVPPGGDIPEGWVLLRAKLERRGGGYAAYLHVETQDGGEGVTFELPVTLKGTILELIELPAGAVRLLLEPMQGEGTFTLGPCSLKRVGQVECLWRMARRVAPMYYKQSRQRRKRAGLHVRTGLLRLREAYRIAGRFRALSPAIPYDRWITEFDTLDRDDVAAIRNDVARLGRRVDFRVVLPDTGDITGYVATKQALAKQFFPGHTRVPDLTAALDGADPHRTWVLVLQPGIEPAPHALYWLARKALANHRFRLIYSDHDRMDACGGRYDPAFKPDWSPELLRSTDYIGPAAAFRADLLAELSPPPLPDGHDLLLRTAERLDKTQIAHIHAVLFHLPPAKPEPLPADPADEGQNPVAAHLERQGIEALVERCPRDHYRIRYALPSDPPLVSIVIATRDQYRILDCCLQSIFAKTTYPRYEVLVVDNQSSDPESLHYLTRLAKRPEVRVLPYDHPFNFAAINNFAASRAKGDVLCLLNNDTEVITRGWLEEMVSHLLQPDVGVVGAKLFYSDGLVQHGGDVVGPGGCANHLHSCLPGDAPGYCDRAILAQELSAVTAACCVTRRALYNHLGGFDAKHLPVAFNDVDYCLRVREAGLRVIWTPYAQLYHYESYSRGTDDTPEKRLRAKQEAAYMRKRWKHVMRHDPYYNPNLSYARPDFSLNHAPLVRKPWSR